MSTTQSVRDSDKSKPYIPLAGVATDGWSTDDSATATCFCGAVQLAFPTTSPGFVKSLVCNCTDCRKLTASMFSSIFIIADPYLEHVRGRESLKTFAQRKSIASGKLMTNHFCGACGTLMYRTGERLPGLSLLRLGTVDDFNLVEGRLRPDLEIFEKDRVSWVAGLQGEGVVKADGEPVDGTQSVAA
ncbi:Mss4-like protein [Paraphoma chrysanthemicola]|nr:Mss4-like protein [Paraphoma chrysanthemicola]